MVDVATSTAGSPISPLLGTAIQKFGIFESSDEMLQKLDALSGGIEMNDKLKAILEDDDSMGFLSGIETFFEQPSHNGHVFSRDSIEPGRVLPARYGHREYGPPFGTVTTFRSQDDSAQLFAGAFVNNTLGTEARTDLKRALRFRTQDTSLMGYATKWRTPHQWSRDELERYNGKAIVAFDEYLDKQIAIVDQGGMTGTQLFSADSFNEMLRAQDETLRQEQEHRDLADFAFRVRVDTDVIRIKSQAQDWTEQ